MNNNPFNGALDAHFEREYEEYYGIGDPRKRPPYISEEETEELLDFLKRGEE